MKSALLRGGNIVVDEIDDPKISKGQVLVKTKACGICGSDLHFKVHGSELIHKMKEMEDSMGKGPISSSDVDISKDVFMGHEFCAEVLETNTDTKSFKSGTLVVSVPIVIDGSNIHQLAYNNLFPAGFSEKMVLSAPFLLEVPNGIDAKIASMTEPLAVGVHAVNISQLIGDEATVVIGCGPVGMCVISALKARNISPVVAVDFSLLRRDVALKIGADFVVDPAEESAFKLLDKIAPFRKTCVFEAVGVPGVIGKVLDEAPRGTKLTVVGVCMEKDTFVPFSGVIKECEIRFSFAYTPDEFKHALKLISEGTVDVQPMISGQVGLDDVAMAFDQMSNAKEVSKLLVVPN